MKRQASTALSDLVLAFSALWGFRMLSEFETERRFGKWWFMLVTIAASLGVVRFGVLMPNYQRNVTKYHTNFSWLCRAIGIPCLAAELCIMGNYLIASQGFLISAVATFIASAIKSPHKDRLTLLINGLSIFTVIGLSVIGGNNMLLGAGLLFLVSAVVGSEGDIAALGLLRVDVLHYTLVAANYCLGIGLTH